MGVCFFTHASCMWKNYRFNAGYVSNIIVVLNLQIICDESTFNKNTVIFASLILFSCKFLLEVLPRRHC